MIEQSITFDNVLNKSKGKIGQYDVVLHAIRKIDPLFEPAVLPKDEFYDCNLLDTLATERSVCKSPAENLLTLKELNNMYRNQIKHEIDGHVEIQSIAKIDTQEPNLLHCVSINNNNDNTNFLIFTIHRKS